MSTFRKGVIALYEKHAIEDLEAEIKDKIAQTQIQLETAEGNDLYRAQGAIQILKWILELPAEIVVMEEEGDRTTE